jgi:amidohydrolase
MVAAATGIRQDIDEILPGVIADRRHFHQHPELGFQEFETARIVAERLQSLGVEDVKTGIAVTGVTGLIRGTKPGPSSDKVVLLRADMDALPIDEQNDVEYKSQVDHKMHACGHDAHTAMLLGISSLLIQKRDQFSGTVKVLFQPAEEGGGGARVMIEEGVLENPKVDYAFGMHIDQGSPVGQISLRPGPSMAAADRFIITIQGKGGHGASPHETVDPISVGAQIVVALQTLVSREVDPIDPAVVTVGALIAGDASNVIPDTAELRGTLRSFNPAVREQIGRRTGEIARGIAEAMRATAEYTHAPGYPSTVNDPEQAELVRQVAVEVVGEENTVLQPMQMGAEDFSYFLEKVPGAFYFVGSRNPERGLVWGHHHPRFDLDEEAMIYGMDVMINTVLRVLGE